LLHVNKRHAYIYFRLYTLNCFSVCRKLKSLVWSSTKLGLLFVAASD